MYMGSPVNLKIFLYHRDANKMEGNHDNQLICIKHHKRNLSRRTSVNSQKNNRQQHKSKIVINQPVKTAPKGLLKRAQL